MSLLINGGQHDIQESPPRQDSQRMELQGLGCAQGRVLLSGGIDNWLRREDRRRVCHPK